MGDSDTQEPESDNARQLLIVLRERLLQQWQERHRSPPAVLHHYTTAEGLLGIVKIGSFHATHAAFLNDPQEITFAEREIRVFLTERRNKCEGAATARSMFYEQLASSIDTVRTKRDLFVASMSEDGDSLSQWQAYAGRGYGFAIGFDGESLRDVYGSPEVIYLRRVIYQASEQQQALNQMADAIEQLLDVVFPSWDDAYVPALLLLVNAVGEILEEFLVTFKHKAFSGEKEWRICVSRTAEEMRSAPMPLVDMRVAGTRVVPFVSIPLTERGASPVRAIRLGPALSADTDKRAVALLLERQNRSDDVKLTMSEIRLR